MKTLLHLFYAAALGCLAFLSTQSIAATGDLDLSFVVGGKVTTAIGTNDTGYAVAIQSDGKIVVAGSSNSSIAVVRYNANGSLDQTFNGTGKVTTSGILNLYAEGKSVALQSDGKIVVAGRTSNGGGTDFFWVRYHSNGALDTSIGNGTGKVRTFFNSGNSSSAESVAIQNDGKIVSAGFTGSNGTNSITLVRHHAYGELDTTFSGDGKLTLQIGAANGVTMQEDGKILVAGTSVQGGAPFNWDFMLVRLHSNGNLDTTFNGTGMAITPVGDGYDAGQSVAMQNDGRIIVAGVSYNGSNYSFALVRYNIDGSLDTTFNGTGKVTTGVESTSGYAHSVAVQADGKIVVAGYSVAPITFDYRFAVVRYNTDGSLDTSFNGTGKKATAIAHFDYGYAVAIQGDGRILVAGVSSRGGTNSDAVFALARYEGAQPGISGPQTVNLGAPVTLTAIPARPNPLTYQWSKDGVDIPGATATSYTIPSAQPWHIGDYKVVVTDSYGVTTSDAALVQINDVPTALWRGLLVYYPFDGNALDREPGASHATISGASLGTDRLGQSNRAFAFDGINDRMTATVPNLPVGNAPRTLSLWAKAQPDPARSVGLVEWGLAQNGRAFGIANSNAPYTWQGQTFGAGAGVNSGVPVDSKWHHLCLTYDSGALSIFFDGVLRQTRAEAIDTGLSPLSMGVGVDGTRFYPGSLDEVRIYNRALSPSEVQQLKASEDPDSDGDGILDRFETGTGIYVSPEDTGTSRTNADTDGDGLTDGQEVNTYLSNPNVFDTDGDGFGDGFEVSTGFSPTSAASTPDAVSSIRTAVEYRFNAANGISYRIEASTDLVGWGTVETNIVGAGGVITRFYSIEGQTRRYFRSRRN